MQTTSALRRNTLPTLLFLLWLSEYFTTHLWFTREATCSQMSKCLCTCALFCCAEGWVRKLKTTSWSKLFDLHVPEYRITLLFGAVAARQKIIPMEWFRRSTVSITGHMLTKQQLEEFQLKSRSWSTALSQVTFANILPDSHSYDRTPLKRDNSYTP